VLHNIKYAIASTPQQRGLQQEQCHRAFAQSLHALHTPIGGFYFMPQARDRIAI